MDALDEVDITAALQSRRAREPDFRLESEGMMLLADELARPEGDVLGALSEIALRHCRADSAGISILEPDGAEDLFRWHAVRGAWACYEGGGLPRNASPCGATIARNAPVLMREPHRVYPRVRDAAPPIHEVLLAPFLILGEPVGTVWVISHSAAREFDAEDSRIVTRLARFASTAFLLREDTRRAAEARDDVLRVNARLKRIIESLESAKAPASAE